MTSAAEAASGPATVRGAHASVLTANRIALAWQRPGSSVAAVEVRVRRGSAPARSLAQGWRGGRLGTRRHSLTVRTLAPATRYTFSIFSTDGRGHVSAPVVVRATTLTATPRLPRAYQSRGGITLRWHNPSAGLARVAVRVAKGAAAPSTLKQGRRIAVKAPRVHAALVQGLARNTRYSASVFAVDRYGRAGAPAVVRFTTPADAGPARQPGTLTGTVVDSNGDPLTNAVVYALDPESDSSGSVARTDTTGTWTLDRAPGSWVIVVDGDHAAGGNSDATGYVADFTDPIAVRAGRTTSAGKQVLRAGAEISGRIVDAHGRGVDYATVYPDDVPVYVGLNGISFDLFVEGAGNYTPDGRWTARGVDPEQVFRICAFASAGRVDGGLPRAYGTSCSRRATVVAPTTSRTLPDLVLTPVATGGGVTGVLRRPDGTPVGGAVYVSARGEADGNGYAVAGRDGRFTISNLPTASYTICGSPSALAQRASWAGFRPTCEKQAVRVTRGAVTRAGVTLGRGAAATGTVRDADGRPVAGVGVTVAGGDKGSDLGDGDTHTTDGHGQWVVKGLAPGRYKACFDGTAVRSPATGTRPGCWNHGRTFPIFAGTRRTGIDGGVRVGAAVSGVVRDATGRPVPDVYVDVYGRAGRDDESSAFAAVDGQGRYTVRGLAAGSVKVCVSSFEDDTVYECGAAVTVRPGRTVRSDVRTPAPSGISVTVQDEQGLPVAAVDAAALLRCQDDEEDDYCPNAPTLEGDPDVDVAGSVMTDADGTATITGLRPGRYALCLYAYYGTTPAGGSSTGYADSCVSRTFDVVVTKGRLTSATMTLAQGGAVSGTVTRSSGGPAAGVRVAVSGSAADDYPRADFFDDVDFGGPGPRDFSVTAADGTFTVIGVRPGQQTVCAQQKPGSAYLAQCIGGVPGKATGGDPVAVVAGQNVAGIRLTMQKGASLGGRVSVAGRYTSRAAVILFAGRRPDVVTYTEPGKDGRWVLRGLAAGSYAVCAGANTAVCWRKAVWSSPAVPPPLAKATLITVASGDARTGIDFALPR
ncbi:fibronectin type III domain-containing protein [Jatrophihabitans fulvus]